MARRLVFLNSIFFSLTIFFVFSFSPQTLADLDDPDPPDFMEAMDILYDPQDLYNMLNFVPIACFDNFSEFNEGLESFIENENFDPSEYNIEDIQKAINDFRAIRTADMEFNTAFKACVAYNNFLTANYEEMEAAKRQRTALYDWQLFASNILLWLVVLVVLTSLFFTGYQLWIAGKSNQKATNSEARISAKEIQITSSSVGIILFSLSLIFLYMFIQEVYTIHISPPETVSQTDQEEQTE